MSAPPLQQSSAAYDERLAFEHMKRTVTKYWPAYWPALEAVLSAAATLQFKDIPASIALFAVGDSGVGKNTIYKMVGWELERVVEWRDKFSLSSLQSGHGQTSAKALQDRALFKKVRNKLLVTPELGLLFRGRPHLLEERFAELAQWLDGEGRYVDTGTHGLLGEKGDYTCVWCAGTTPFYIDTWRTMAALGTRILFFEILKGHYLPDSEYPVAIAECRAAVNCFLDLLLPPDSIRTGDWPTTDAKVEVTLQNYAALLALGHGLRENMRYGDNELHFPTPNHFRSRLGHMVRGRARVYGRYAVIDEDLVMARWITQSSMPGRRGPVLLALLESVGGAETVETIAKSTGLAGSTGVQYVEVVGGDRRR